MRPESRNSPTSTTRFSPTRNVNGELVSSADFNISQWTEAEVEAILQHLTNQNALMLEILKRVEGLEKSRDQVN